MPTVKQTKYLQARKVHLAREEIRYLHERIDEYRAKERSAKVRCTDITENKLGTVYHFV